MKKKMMCVFAFTIACLFTAGSVSAEEIETAKWAQNNPDVSIYSPDVQGDGFYHVGYDNIDAELVNEADTVRLLMINGGFVPDPQIIVKDARTLVPIRIVSELLGAKVDWNGSEKPIIITDGSTVISLTIGNKSASINNKQTILDVPPAIINGKTYVPIRFVAEALSADVGYVPSFASGTNSRPGKEKVSAVTIERISEDVKTFTPEEGLVEVKKASSDEYNVIIEFYKLTNQAFNEMNKENKDYDSQAITYTNQNIGRHYVYELKDFEQYRILFNKYTGEVYSEGTGLPIFSIGNGFINISWLYQ